MARKKLSLLTVKKEVSRISGVTDENDPSFISGVILLSSAFVGANIRRVAKFTGYSASVVRGRARLLRDNGVWRGGKVACDWTGEVGGVAFLMDVLVAEGMVERRD